MIDLRSDAVTKLSLGMRQAMFEIEEGDDVMEGVDPTVYQLETYAAELLGKEEALLVATGTQGNLLSVLSHCQRGEEYVVAQQAHLYRWENQGTEIVGGVFPQPIEAEKDGTLDFEKMGAVIRQGHAAMTRLIALENTYHGKALPLSYLKKAADFARSQCLKVHIDGARLFNAAVACSIPAKELAQHCDSVTFCLSKSLGAPMGALICADKAFIERARQWRKIVGGRMRQAGVIAAAGLFALKNNIDRLAEDHQNAVDLGEGLMQIPNLQGKVHVHTNMVFVEVGQEGREIMPPFFRARGILIFGTEILRLVTHLNVSQSDVEQVIAVFKDFYANHKK